MITEVEGDLIEYALSGKCDVVVHGCNCFCTMKKGLAPLMVKAFQTDEYPLEKQIHKGDIDKLGRLDWKTLDSGLAVVNAYTQYHYRYNSPDGFPLDYAALRMCLRKIDLIFQNEKIALPRIGAGLAGGDWNVIKEMMKDMLINCDVTIVNLP